MNDTDMIFYWFSIEPYVYVDIKQGVALLYNSESKETFIFRDEQLIQILTRCIESQRQGICISRQDYVSHKKVIDSLVEKNLVVCFRLCNNGGSLPFRFKDELHFEKDFISFSKDDDFALYHTADLFNELMQINIYVTTECGSKCDVCQVAARQCLYCFSEERCDSLPIKIFEDLVSSVYYTNCCINILGGDVFSYPEFDKMLSLISAYIKQQFCMYCNSNAIEKLIRKIDVLPRNVCLVILCNDVDEYCKTIRSIPKKIVDKILNYTVLLHSENEMGRMEQLNGKNTRFIPIYNGRNADFFERMLYVCEDDLMHSDINMNQIAINKKFNSVNYGTIDVFPDGTVKANFNNSPLGNLSEGLENLLWKEMKRTDGWMKTRTEKPCSDCVFQYLCPPPSNYEIVIGKPNLCTVKP